VVLLWFSPWWFGGKNLAPLDLQSEMMSPWRNGNDVQFAKNHIVSDAIDQYLVYRMVAAESFKKEGWVGWSSLTYGGTPQYANTMALYYDWTMQLHRWFDFWTAWHLGLMGQVFLAAAGMLLFLRGRGISNVWACCGALAYAANSQFVTWIYHRWTLSAFCWVPWVLWAIDGFRQGKRHYWSAVPLFMALAFLGGTLQHAALVVLAAAAIWFEEAATTQKGLMSNAPSPGKDATQRTSLVAVHARLLLRYGVWGILGVGLAAMMFVPCIPAFMESNRLGLHTGMNTNIAKSIYPEGSLQPLLNLFAYPLQIFPSILGSCTSLDVMKLFKSELFYIFYFGSLPVLITYLSIFRKDSSVLAKCLIAIGLILPLTPLVRFLYQRVFLLSIIGGILAFTQFMQFASRESRMRIWRIVSSLTAVGILGWLILSFALTILPNVVDQLRSHLLAQASFSSFGFFKSWITLRVDNFIHDLHLWNMHAVVPLSLLVAGLLGLRLTASIAERKRAIGALMVAAVVIAEVTLFAAQWVTFADPNHYSLFPKTPESEALHQYLGVDDRVTTLIHPQAHMARTPFVSNTLSAYQIATISGYDSIIPNGMILPNDSPGDAQKLGRLGVSHLITYPENSSIGPGWSQIWQSHQMALYENTAKIARYVGFENDTDKDGFFNHRPSVNSHVLTERLHLENSREIEVPVGIKWVRIAENQSQGWEYQIPSRSDAWQAVIRSPDASMLIPVDPAALTEPTTILMRYHPRLRALGFTVSGISLALTAAGAWLACRRNWATTPIRSL